MPSVFLIKYPESLLDNYKLDSPFPPDSEIGLTREGRAVAERIGSNLAARLKGHFFVWSGPALRCSEAARIVATRVGADARQDPRLGERRIFKAESRFTVRDFRSRQERGYLDPAYLSPDEDESPLSHRIRVEAWSAEMLANLKPSDVHLIISHGAVVEHLHSSLSWKPAGAMVSSFAFCAPGHAHVWSMIQLPDGRRIWCCLGSNINLSEILCLNTPLRGLEDLNGLAVGLASDSRFQNLANAGVSGLSAIPPAYYIR